MCYNAAMDFNASLHFILAQASAPQSGFVSGMGGMAYSSVDILGMVILIAVSLIGAAVQRRMMYHMNRFAQTRAPLTGAQTAERMLRDHGISSVKIVHTPGMLTDHFNPTDNTVNLSEMVYSQASVAAMAVAAHECGHAIQRERGYAWIGLRSMLVPIVQLGSRMGQVVLIVGIILLAMGSGPTVAWVGCILFATTTLFAFVTLPVEFDASRRALAWLESSGMVNRAMHDEARTALRWAAMTYVAGALASLAMLLYYVIMILSRSSNRQ